MDSSLQSTPSATVFHLSGSELLQPSTAKPTILAGHKYGLFQIHMQSICILFIYMLSIHSSVVMLSPGSSADDPFLTKSYHAHLFFL